MANLLPAPPPLRCPPSQWANLPSPAGLHDRCRRPRSWRSRAPAAIHAPDQTPQTQSAEQVRSSAASGTVPAVVIPRGTSAKRDKAALSAHAPAHTNANQSRRGIHSDCFHEHGFESGLHARQATPLNIEGLSREYCDEFSCSSSPAVENTMRILSRDIQRRGVTRSLYGPTVQYRVTVAAFVVPLSCHPAVDGCQHARRTLVPNPTSMPVRMLAPFLIIRGWPDRGHKPWLIRPRRAVRS